MPNKKRLVLVRHAHRDTSKGRERDNGLSAKGWRQVEKFLSAWNDVPPERTGFVSSPKKRCFQTLDTLATEKGLGLQISDELLENETESNKAFKKRVKKEIEKLSKTDAELLFVCSHGDWIEEANKILSGKRYPLKKGRWTEHLLN